VLEGRQVAHDQLGAHDGRLLYRVRIDEGLALLKQDLAQVDHDLGIVFFVKIQVLVDQVVSVVDE